jgi:farnesyl diphosphate synthase
MSPDFTSQLTKAVRLVEAKLDDCLPSAAQSLLAEPMRHAVLNGGKRLRGFLVLETAGLFDVDVKQALYAAAAIECIHAYSLVHDDLPCMDDDDLRRGLPTVHVKWDEATAVLVGDALQTLAFEILAVVQ